MTCSLPPTFVHDLSRRDTFWANEACWTCTIEVAFNQLQTGPRTPRRRLLPFQDRGTMIWLEYINNIKLWESGSQGSEPINVHLASVLGIVVKHCHSSKKVTMQFKYSMPGMSSLACNLKRVVFAKQLQHQILTLGLKVRKLKFS